MTVSIELVPVPLAALRALANGDRAAAADATGLPITEYLVGQESLGTWTYRYRQISADPAAAAWTTGVVYDRNHRRCVGKAGYHGPPDQRGMVEVGYAIDPEFRRRGYARAALVAMLERAAREPLVHIVRASVAPDNTPSLALISQYGFVQVGEQEDEEDGLEFVYEVAA